ncbi:hypothetical protein M8818_001189 [Zalaria obscura]|uniref:Uncharacterized protein n=1 Tax=Zalaria obscura TaxID=2024903 RepID=A0ACC3SNL9_9PEZI
MVSLLCLTVAAPRFHLCTFQRSQTARGRPTSANVRQQRGPVSALMFVPCSQPLPFAIPPGTSAARKVHLQLAGQAHGSDHHCPIALVAALLMQCKASSSDNLLL